MAKKAPHFSPRQHQEGTAVCMFVVYLLAEQSIEKFEENIEKFILYWENRESTFIKYFRDTYLNRKGKLRCV